MNYKQIARMATSGIKFFSDANGEFCCYMNRKGTVKMVHGVEVEEEEQTAKIKGLIRSPKQREIDGEIIRATDKIGIFTNEVELKNGYHVEVDGEMYVITEARPVRQTNITVAYRPILRRVSICG
ncbi:MAG: hypothetical protein ACI4MH_01960 [Candidatus Coproplasma sp.]